MGKILRRTHLTQVQSLPSSKSYTTSFFNTSELDDMDYLLCNSAKISLRTDDVHGGNSHVQSSGGQTLMTENQMSWIQMLVQLLI